MTTEETELTFIRCPSCRSLVPAVATRCRMCGHNFEAQASEPPPPAAEQRTRSRVRQRTISASADEVSRDDEESPPSYAPPASYSAASTPSEDSEFSEPPRTAGRLTPTNYDPFADEDSEAAPDATLFETTPPGFESPSPAGARAAPEGIGESLFSAKTGNHEQYTEDNESLTEASVDFEEKSNFSIRGGVVSGSDPGWEIEEAPLPDPLFEKQTSETSSLFASRNAPDQVSRPEQVWDEAEEDEGEGEDDGEGDFGGDSGNFAAIEPEVAGEISGPSGGKKRRRRRRKRKSGAQHAAGLEATPAASQQPNAAPQFSRPAQAAPVRPVVPEVPRVPEIPRFSGKAPAAEKAPSYEPAREHESGRPFQVPSGFQAAPAFQATPPAAPVHAPPVRAPAASAPSGAAAFSESLRQDRQPPATNELIGGPMTQTDVSRPRANGSQSQTGFSSSATLTERDTGVLVGWLVSYSSDVKGISLELRGGRFFVGGQRLREHDIVIADRGLSAPHSLVAAIPGTGLRVQDLMSESGTFVKRRGANTFERINDVVNVEHGDLLRFGEYEVLVCLLP